MKQLKIIRKKETYLIEIKISRTQTISERDLETIEKNVGSNFLPITIDSRKSTCVLRYNVSGLLQISEFLKMNFMSKRMFIYIIQQYIRFDKLLEQNYCKKSSVLYDVNFIFIDPTSWHIYFAYVPIQPFEGDSSMRSSLQNLIQYATFDPNEDLQYVQDYIKLVGNNASFSVFLLQEFLKKNEEKKENTGSIKKCSSCGFRLQDSDVFCPMCGKEISKSASRNDNRPNNQTGKDFSNEKVFPTKSNEFSISEDETGVVTVFRAKTSKDQVVALLNSDGRIVITHFPFRIGKQADIVDYQILSSTVSRKHADFIREQGKIHIVDLGSTNGTFINGRRIQTGVKEELHSGDKVSFANISYDLVIEER